MAPLLTARAITYDDGAVAAELLVHPATALIGARRARLLAQARAVPETDPDRALLALYSYPDLIAPTTGTLNGQPVEGLTFEEFLKLPDQLFGQWEQTVYELNRHWLPEVVDDAKKEAEPSTSG